MAWRITGGRSVIPNMETNVVDDDGAFRSANYQTGHLSEQSLCKVYSWRALRQICRVTPTPVAMSSRIYVDVPFASDIGSSIPPL